MADLIEALTSAEGTKASREFKAEVESTLERPKCMYCHAPIDAMVYDGTCLTCTAQLLVILGSGAIERRLRIEKRKGSDAALRKAIKEARKTPNKWRP